MIVHQDKGRGPKLQRPFDHFARVDRRVIYSAFLLDFVSDEHIFPVEKENAELLCFVVGH